VGKSTIAVNLAIALSKKGLSVGFLDADVHGPSIAVMLRLRRLRPNVEQDVNGVTKVTPFTKFGMKSASIGFFVEESPAVVWRGPALHTALQKMMTEVEWGELDVLLMILRRVPVTFLSRSQN